MYNQPPTVRCLDATLNPGFNPRRSATDRFNSIDPIALPQLLPIRRSNRAATYYVGLVHFCCAPSVGSCKGGDQQPQGGTGWTQPFPHPAPPLGATGSRQLFSVV